MIKDLQLQVKVIPWFYKTSKIAAATEAGFATTKR